MREASYSKFDQQTTKPTELTCDERDYLERLLQEREAAQ